MDKWCNPTYIFKKSGTASRNKVQFAISISQQSFKHIFSNLFYTETYAIKLTYFFQPS